MLGTDRPHTTSSRTYYILYTLPLYIWPMFSSAVCVTMSRRDRSTRIVLRVQLRPHPCERPQPCGAVESDLLLRRATGPRTNDGRPGSVAQTGKSARISQCQNYCTGSHREVSSFVNRRHAPMIHVRLLYRTSRTLMLLLGSDSKIRPPAVPRTRDPRPSPCGSSETRDPALAGTPRPETRDRARG